MTSDEGNKRCAELRLAMTAALAIVVGANVHAADMALHMDRIGTVDRHVEGLLARMTVEEKFAQRFTTWINYWLLTHVLCGKWRFDSAMVSDCKAVERLADLRHVAAHPCDTAIQTGRAGVDVDMPDGVSLQRFVGAVRANVGKSIAAVRVRGDMTESLFPFGLGLSYTTCDVGTSRLSSERERCI